MVAVVLVGGGMVAVVGKEVVMATQMLPLAGYSDAERFHTSFCLDTILRIRGRRVTMTPAQQPRAGSATQFGQTSTGLPRWGPAAWRLFPRVRGV